MTVELRADLLLQAAHKQTHMDIVNMNVLKLSWQEVGSIRFFDTQGFTMWYWDSEGVHMPAALPAMVFVTPFLHLQRPILISM